MSYYNNPFRSNTRKTAIAIGLVCGVLVIGIGMISLICRNNRSTPYDLESIVARSQQRREDSGWWGAAPAPVETAAERRRRNVQARANRGPESGVEREAREGEAAPPIYQSPAPAYYMNPELRRQYQARRQQTPLPLLPQENDAPPAYDSPAVWPTRT